MRNFRLLLWKSNYPPWFSAYWRIRILSDVKIWAPWNTKPLKKTLATLKNPSLISSWLLLHNGKGGEVFFFPLLLFFSFCCPLWARKIIDFYTRSPLQIWTSSVVDQLQRGIESSRRDKSAWENLSFPFSRGRFQKTHGFWLSASFWHLCSSWELVRPCMLWCSNNTAHISAD